MKKSCAMICFAFLFLLGCEKPVDRTVVPLAERSFQTTVTVELCDWSLQGILSRDDGDSFQFEITSPDPLAGMTLREEGENFTLWYNGLTAAYPTDRSLIGGPVCLLFDAVRLTNNGEKPNFSAVLPDGTVFSAEFDPDNGEPVCFSIPEHDLSVRFSDFIDR